VLEAARAAFPSPGSALEVTLEANPDDLPREVLFGLARAGINRLSIGAQSFDAGQLERLGRLHGADETRRVVSDAREAKFGNLSLDLIYALPGQEIGDLANELEALLALEPQHTSIYQLTVEARTPFDAYVKRGDMATCEPELCAEMAELVDERVRGAGLRHYEVSSFARPGFESRHNSLYWRGGEWLGLGCAAHSFRRTMRSATRGGERWSTVKNVDEYMRRVAASPLDEVRSREPGTHNALGGGLVAHHEALDEETLAREAMWLGLRLLDRGLDRAAFVERFGVDPSQRFAATLAPLVGGGLIEETPSALRLSRRGALLADEIGLRFL
jgi:oxygen-independent coproporphyrinogen-3 oxidase